MKKYALILFFFFALVELTTHLIDLPNIHHVSKPMLLITLALYYYYSVKHEGVSTIIMLALFFSWLGDVMLMYVANREIYFMLGLGAFLIAHVFYIFAYQQYRIEDTSKALLGVQRFRFSFPIILAGTGLVTILYNHLGDMKIPVMVYALVIVLMVLNALFRFGRTTLTSFSMVFFGATLFMISDSLIAIGKFLDPIPYGGFWVMITYISAQYLIVEGLIRHKP